LSSNLARLPVLLAVLLLLVAASAAEARWFAVEPIDPGGQRPVVDLGIEEGGAVAYVKGGVAWLSQLGSRGWGAPVALSAPNTTEAAVAAGEEGRLAAAWIQDGNVVGGLVGAPASPLSSGGGATDLAIDMGVNGVAYAVWTQGGDVRAARLHQSSWQAVPAPLDVDPARSAGVGAGRPKVAVAADGSALVAWGEVLPDGLTHVFARRVYGTALSALPQDATLAGGSADSPEVDIEYDRSYAWVAFRQDVAGASHTFARRLRASTFEQPYALDRGIASAGPDVSMSSSGVGHGVSVTGDGWLVGAPLRDDAFSAAGRLDRAGAVSAAVLATSERDDSAVAWLAGDVLRGRWLPDRGRAGGPALLARGAAGPLSASANRIGDTAVAVVAGGAVGVAMYDLPPSAPTLRDLPDVVRRRVLVRWVPGQEFGGRQRYRVLVDGRLAGATTGTSLRVRLRRGRHRITVVGVDRRGQRSSRSRRQTVVVR
jgi:hypothetical protein